DTRKARHHSLRHSALLFGADASAQSEVPIGGGDEDLPKPGHWIREERGFRLRGQTQILDRLPCGGGDLNTLLVERLAVLSRVFVGAQSFGVDDEVVGKGMVPVQVV